MYSGKTMRCEVKDNIANIIFDNTETGSNVFNGKTLDELTDCLVKVKEQSNLVGLVFTSARNHFVLGADITEFLGLFKQTDAQLEEWLAVKNRLFNGFEDLPFPTVTAINGYALGGGFEICLTTSFRIASTQARIGLPETQLGIMPGWGGTVRLPRISGADHAIEWITSGKQYKAEAAQKIGLVDGIVDSEKLYESAVKLINRANAGDIDWKAKNEQKKNPLTLNKIEAMMAFETSKAFVAAKVGKNYPAPVKAIEVMQATQRLKRDEALAIEAKAFVELTRTPACESLIQVFLGDQYLKKVSRKITKQASPINQAAVLGAGIMGGGIAYQSAYKGTPILMKDINTDALELGMGEATKLLGKLVKRKRIDAAKLGTIVSKITPTLSYGDFSSVNMVVEAVVENEKIKDSVLCDLEKNVAQDTIIASNTSTISITKLAKNLKRPENFCGMHFFNPVHKMPLVEIIRGEKTSEKAIAQTVAYAMAMGKTPIVVNDCPGFLVNRVLFPYFNGFIKLVQDGIDFQRIDKVMQKFGWPMGPAYLLDVVGIDTAFHCVDIMGEAFPDRMAHEGDTVLTGLFKKNYFGQKNGKGFFKYEVDKKGRPKKIVDESIYDVIKPYYKNSKEVSDDEIIERMMFPMVIECVRCLDENIVNSPAEVDMGLLLGLGFPPFRAGALKYADQYGIKEFVEKSMSYEAYGQMYNPTESLITMAKNSKKFYEL
jgi:3-hydroxyacyl-CoA dehydrogenase/enoyl-CoA hydratase/3-hydroxybutyryl-CoA epimerase/enoyl-CoA isomerase